jgi:hypothetical protein
MMQSDGSYCPVHAECGKQHRKLSHWERKKLLLQGHLPRYCDSCQRTWLLAISEEEKVALAREQHPLTEFW